MSVRKNSVKLGVAVAATCGLAITAAAPAGALDGGPTTSPKLGTDIIAVGSDTTQWVMDKLVADYNTAVTTGPRMINYDACVGATDPAHATGLGSNPDGSGFPCGADNTGTKAGVPRPATDMDPAAPGGAIIPNGSGNGRALLRTATDPLFKDVAFARSSAAAGTADIAAGLLPIPFAVDKIVPAVSPAGPAPASLTGQQILRIFNGTYTNWNQVGGANAPIHPYLPKTGSGTQQISFVFLAALDGVTEAPGSDNDPTSHSAAFQTWQGPGVTITDANWKTGSTNVEEHDPSIIQADPNAIELFSYARAQMANSKNQLLRIEGGWSEDREQYNVVRGKAISGAATTPFLYGSDNNVLESIFSNTGWICTNATAQADIAALGDWPLNSKVCGVANTNTLDTINPFASTGVGEGPSTTTSAYYSGGKVHVTVDASDGSVPTGSVQVVIAPPAVAGAPGSKASFVANKALANGEASVSVPSTLAGSRIVDVAFLPTNFGAQNSAGGHTAAGSSYTEFSHTFTAAKPKVSATATKVGKKYVVKIKTNQTGKAKVKVNGHTFSSSISAGKATVNVPLRKLASGKNKAVVSVKGASTKVTLKK
ncbi:MAG TPA: substrate-binding domain-containing protein [Mycobacteriales bacterium]|nr:substrate-binding domain-containing protein [Mycobacteriales bacterium]